MERLRRALLTPEVPTNRWSETQLESDLFYREGPCLGVLSTNDGSEKKVYTMLTRFGLTEYSAGVDIPLKEPTPTNILVEQAYLNSTFFGEIDPEKYRKYALNPYNASDLLAFLNRTEAQVESDEMPQWFYENFQVEHLESYGRMYIGSHGGSSKFGHTFNATIEYNSNKDNGGKSIVEEAVAISRDINRSFSGPHIELSPLPVNDYLDILQTTLKFCPQDWEI